MPSSFELGERVVQNGVELSVKESRELGVPRRRGAVREALQLLKPRQRRRQLLDVVQHLSTTGTVHLLLHDWDYLQHYLLDLMIQLTRVQARLTTLHTTDGQLRALCRMQISWSLTSFFSTNMAISETKGQGWEVISTQ